MKPGDNIFELLKDSANIQKSAFKKVKAHFSLLGELIPYQNKKAFVLFKQPGAKAPVGPFLKQWMDANLGGCTDEICAIAGQQVNFGQVVLNTMTPEEQEAANIAILDAKKVDVSGLSIVNDPERVLVDFLGMAPEEMKTVETRTAYLPKAYVFNASGELHKVIENNPKEDGKARAFDDYLQAVKDAVDECSVEQHQEKKIKVNV